MTPCPRCAELVRENEKMALEIEILRRTYLRTHEETKFMRGVLWNVIFYGLNGEASISEIEMTNLDKRAELETRKDIDGTFKIRALAPAQPEAKIAIPYKMTASMGRFAPPEAGKCPHGGELSPVSGMCAGDCSAGKCEECGGKGFVADSAHRSFIRCVSCQPPDKEVA